MLWSRETDMTKISLTKIIYQFYYSDARYHGDQNCTYDHAESRELICLGVSHDFARAYFIYLPIVRLVDIKCLLSMRLSEGKFQQRKTVWWYHKWKLRWMNFLILIAIFFCLHAFSFISNSNFSPKLSVAYEIVILSLICCLCVAYFNHSTYKEYRVTYTRDCEETYLLHCTYPMFKY